MEGMGVDIYDFGRHLIDDLELGFPRSNLEISVCQEWDGMWVGVYSFSIFVVNLMGALTFWMCFIIFSYANCNL